MTTLMIKTHKITGLKYFCKTTKTGKAFEKYNGSGVDWVIHIKEFGNDIHTFILKQFDETNNIQKLMLEGYALEYSELNNVVNSKKWANKQPENGLDGVITKWSLDKLQEIAYLFKHKIDFLNKYPSAYNTAQTSGVLNEICKHMTRPDTTHKWFLKNIQIEAKKYTYKSDFQKSKAYSAAQSLGILDLVCVHMTPKPRKTKWDYNTLLTEASKYNNKRDFIKHCGGACVTARKLKVWKDITSHMHNPVNVIDKVTIKDIIVKIKISKSKTDFQKKYSIYYRKAKELNVYEKLKVKYF